MEVLLRDHQDVIQIYHFAGTDFGHPLRGEGTSLGSHGTLMLAPGSPEQKSHPLSNQWPSLRSVSCH